MLLSAPPSKSVRVVCYTVVVEKSMAIMMPHRGFELYSYSYHHSVPSERKSPLLSTSDGFYPKYMYT